VGHYGTWCFFWRRAMQHSVLNNNHATSLTGLGTCGTASWRRIARYHWDAHGRLAIEAKPSSHFGRRCKVQFGRSSHLIGIRSGRRFLVIVSSVPWSGYQAPLARLRNHLTLRRWLGRDGSVGTVGSNVDTGALVVAVVVIGQTAMTVSRGNNRNAWVRIHHRHEATGK
jgi:hypothetical protein